MPPYRKMVVMECLDESTGIRFVEDIRGNLYPVPDFNVVLPELNIPAPEVHITVSGGTGDTTNNYSTTNNYEQAQQDRRYENATLVVLHTIIKSTNWPNVTDFHRIQNSYSPGSFLNYTVPFGKKFEIVSLVASQYLKGEGNQGLSALGLFKSGSLLLSFPLIDNLNYEFIEPISLTSAQFLEIKYRPHDKKAELSVLLLGYLI